MGVRALEGYCRTVVGETWLGVQGEEQLPE